MFLVASGAWFLLLDFSLVSGWFLGLFLVFVFWASGSQLVLSALVSFCVLFLGVRSLVLFLVLIWFQVADLWFLISDFRLVSGWCHFLVPSGFKLLIVVSAFWCQIGVWFLCVFLMGFWFPIVSKFLNYFLVSGWCLVGGCLYSGLVLDCFLIGFWFSWFLFSDFRLVSF